MATDPSPDKSSRFNVLNEVHQRLHDMKNLQRASAWPHVEGVARAEKMVWDMISACQPKDSEPFTPSATPQKVFQAAMAWYDGNAPWLTADLFSACRDYRRENNRADGGKQT